MLASFPDILFTTICIYIYTGSQNSRYAQRSEPLNPFDWLSVGRFLHYCTVAELVSESLCCTSA